MMSSTLPLSCLSFGTSPPSGRCDGRSVAHFSDPVPFLLYSSGSDPGGLDLYKRPLRAPGPALLPYLAPFHHGPFGMCECPLEPAFIHKRNERERQRVRCVNRGYATLRDHLPGHGADTRLSKVETLRAAIRYIKYLQDLVQLGGRQGAPDGSSPGPDCQGTS